jgi:hypothetical protein
MKTTGMITPNLRRISESDLSFRQTFLAESPNISGPSPSFQSRTSLNDDQLLAILDEALELSDVSLAIMEDAIPDAPAVKPAVPRTQ